MNGGHGTPGRAGWAPARGARGGGVEKRTVGPGDERVTLAAPRTTSRARAAPTSKAGRGGAGRARPHFRRRPGTSQEESLPSSRTPHRPGGPLWRSPPADLAPSGPTHVHPPRRDAPALRPAPLEPRALRGSDPLGTRGTLGTPDVTDGTTTAPRRPPAGLGLEAPGPRPAVPDPSAPGPRAVPPTPFRHTPFPVTSAFGRRRQGGPGALYGRTGGGMLRRIFTGRPRTPRLATAHLPHNLSIFVDQSRRRRPPPKTPANNRK